MFYGIFLFVLVFTWFSTPEEKLAKKEKKDLKKIHGYVNLRNDLDRHENCLRHGQHTSGTKQRKLRNQRDMAYLVLKILDNVCKNHQNRTLLTPFIIN